jgi:serine/threonine protein kinase
LETALFWTQKYCIVKYTDYKFDNQELVEEIIEEHKFNLQSIEQMVESHFQKTAKNKSSIVFDFLILQTEIYGWSVGVILYQLLSGKLPFSQPDITSLYGALMKLSPEVLPSIIPPRLREVVNRALAKSPEQRFSSAGEMEPVTIRGTIKKGRMAEAVQTAQEAASTPVRNKLIEDYQ